MINQKDQIKSIQNYDRISQAEDYYRIRGLIPQNLMPKLENLNARLVITNYHTFEARTLQGNKKSPFDGIVDLEGKKINPGKKDGYNVPLIPNSNFSGYQLLAYYYVSFSLSAPQLRIDLQLPFNREYSAAKYFE